MKAVFYATDAIKMMMTTEPTFVGGLHNQWSTGQYTATWHDNSRGLEITAYLMGGVSTWPNDKSRWQSGGIETTWLVETENKEWQPDPLDRFIVAGADAKMLMDRLKEMEELLRDRRFEERMKNLYTVLPTHLTHVTCRKFGGNSTDLASSPQAQKRCPMTQVSFDFIPTMKSL